MRFPVNRPGQDGLLSRLIKGVRVDEILVTMAGELRQALIELDLDPKNPPGGMAPAASAWEEYQNRGGDTYTEQHLFMEALIEEVGK